MEFLVINENDCRICLDKPGSVDWNEELLVFCGVTYKHCYFKYTQLDYTDNFSEMLCESCATDLKNAHFLLEKAIESHNSLQQTFAQWCQISTTEDQKYATEIEDEPTYFENVLISEQSTDSSSEDDNKKDEIVKTCPETSTNLIKETIKPAEILQPQLNAEPLSKQEKIKKNTSKRIREKSHIMCTHCSKLIVAENIKMHEDTHKEQRERTVMCPKCGIKLYNRTSLYSHMLTHKENREKKYKCEFCDKSYFNRGALNVHRRIHLRQMVSCSICSKEFFRQIDLDKHNIKVHSSSLLHSSNSVETFQHKYYVECKDCGKNVPSRRWKHHREVHLNKFQMQCTLCDKQFVSKNRCHQHVARAHKKTKDDFAKVVKYYGDNINNRTSHLLIRQTEKVKPALELTNLI